MQKTTNLITLIVAVLMLSSCCTMTCAPEQSDDLKILADWMTGFFSSLEQSTADPQYWDIHLHMAPIWPERNNGYWIYVEQAMAGKDPYRQRIYHLTEPDPGRFASKVFELDNPGEYIGAWDDPSVFAALTPEDLVDRPGCTIYLVRESDGTYRGSTHEQDCISDLRGAAYATSLVRVSAEELVSWDRGFDSDGKQVWGAIKQGYIFHKLENYPL